jgi:hypothetical protein
VADTDNDTDADNDAADKSNPLYVKATQKAGVSLDTIIYT